VIYSGGLYTFLPISQNAFDVYKSRSTIVKRSTSSKVYIKALATSLDAASQKQQVQPH